MFLPVMEFAVAVMIMVVIFTQIIIPIFRGTPIFPALQQPGIEARLENARQELRIVRLEKELAELKQLADESRQQQGAK